MARVSRYFPPNRWRCTWSAVRYVRLARRGSEPFQATIDPEATASLTQAITLHCTADRIWPWLAQMGAGRAGWYSYDAIDNGGKPSAERIVPELQAVEVGYLFPWLPHAVEGFVVLACEKARGLVLGAPAPDGHAFVRGASCSNRVRLQPRLIARSRANASTGLAGFGRGWSSGSSRLGIS